MGHQIHKRLPLEFVVDVLRAFCEKEVGVNKACQLLGISKVQLYRLRKRYIPGLKPQDLDFYFTMTHLIIYGYQKLVFLAI